jgi:hypothetical protein
MHDHRQLSRWHVLAALLVWLCAPGAGQAWQVQVVNIIPNDWSNETNQDSEPNVAVNPANAADMAVSAFTKSLGYCPPEHAPIFVSTTGGSTWSLNCIIPSNPAGTGTNDITVRFSPTTGTLYAGILRRPGKRRMNVLRTSTFTGSTPMTPLVERQNVDQPYIQVTAIGGSDRVYVGSNDLNLSTIVSPDSPAADTRTATLELSLNADTACCPPAPPPPNFEAVHLEECDNAGQNGPPIRPAVHQDGTVYAVFYRWTATSGNFKPAATITANVVVVRDDTGGTGSDPFTDLTTPAPAPGDCLHGRTVVTNRTVPYHSSSQWNFGQERFVASNLSIAVDPANSSTVYIAWADRVGVTDYTLHVRRSLDRGVTWSNDLRTVTNATNPALAINGNGTVGFLYQQRSGTGFSQRWMTRTELTNDAFATVQTYTLADVPATAPAKQVLPYIGDYIHLMTVGATFYGVFSANNTPDHANFPSGVAYQRHADFTTHTLLDTDNTASVAISIDPFFFTIREVSLPPCITTPWLCVHEPRLEPGLIVLKCPFPSCRVIDPLPLNCLVKYQCPGCRAGGLCPPYYHVFFDNLDKSWDIGLFDAQGRPVPHQQFDTETGTVISFRPHRQAYLEGQVGNYFLAFEMGQGGKPGAEYAVKTRLQRSDTPYSP